MNQNLGISARIIDKLGALITEVLSRIVKHSKNFRQILIEFSGIWISKAIEVEVEVDTGGGMWIIAAKVLKSPTAICAAFPFAYNPYRF